MNDPSLSASHQQQRDSSTGVTVLSFSATPSTQTAVLTATVEGLATVTWQSSKASLQVDETQEALVIQVALTFHRLHLAVDSLLQPLIDLEQQAVTDVALCYRIDRKDRAHWPRLFALMQQLAGTRLQIAQLLAELSYGHPDLPGPAAKLLRRLTKAAGLKSRLQHISDRYEALEDLYEGGVDRINDHRYWRDGHVLEVIIIIALLAEALLLL